MACGIISMSGTGCSESIGGVLRFAVADYEDITSGTFDANGNLLTLVLANPTAFVLFTPDDDSTARFSDTGEGGNGEKIDFTQEGFASFEGITAAKRQSANALKKCCALVVVYETTNGKVIVQGLVQKGTGIATTYKKCKAIPTITTDTDENKDRVEILFKSKSKDCVLMAGGTATFESLTGL